MRAAALRASAQAAPQRCRGKSARGAALLLLETRDKGIAACLQVNKSPFDDGWLMKVKLSDEKGDMKQLMDAKAYKQEIE